MFILVYDHFLSVLESFEESRRSRPTLRLSLPRMMKFRLDSGDEVVSGLFFRKTHGAGNDFILVSGTSDGREQDWPALARKLCARRTGIGADGLVISSLRDNDKTTLDVTCFNADGSMATMCGNALRCAAAAASEDHSLTEMSLFMANVEHKALVQDDTVWVTAEVGAIDVRRVEAVFEGHSYRFDSAHTGTEHVVAVVEDVDAVDVERFGPLIRYHPDLAPVGTNVNFIHAVNERALKIRTYERGVEAETLSCGSGAAAAAVIAAARGLVSRGQVTVHNRSGTPLIIRPHSERPDTVWISGPVVQVFQGEVTV